MSKRQKKTKEEVIYKSLVLVVFLILMASYNNCSDIRLMGALSQSTNNSSNNPGDPADPKGDTINYIGATEHTGNPDGSLESCKVDSEGGIFAAGELTTVSGPNVPKTGVASGVPYEMIIAVGGISTSTEGCNQPGGKWDPFPTYGIDQRHNAYRGSYSKIDKAFKGGIISFRVRTPKDPFKLDFQYYQQNGMGDLIGLGVYSVSKIPGEIDLNKTSSQSYCNLGGKFSSQDSMDVSDIPIQVGASKCRLMQDSVYYFNVLNKTQSPEYINQDFMVFRLLSRKY